MGSHTKGNVLTGERCTVEPGNYHFGLAGCDDCNARRLVRCTLDRVEHRYHGGYIRQAMFEAYMHVWATGAHRFSSAGVGWQDPPNDPEVAALVQLLREVASDAQS